MSNKPDLIDAAFNHFQEHGLLTGADLAVPRESEAHRYRRHVIDKLVNRFLGWPLPKDFAPDCHISFKLPDPVLNPNPSWPVGTNLFTAEQARQMFEYLLESRGS